MDPIIRNRFTACTGRLALATLLAMFPLLSPAAEGLYAIPAGAWKDIPGKAPLVVTPH